MSNLFVYVRAAAVNTGHLQVQLGAIYRGSAAMSKKNKLAARREAHERLLERERQQKAKKEAKRLKFQARAPKKRSIPKGLVRGSSRNPEQYEEARRIVKLRKKAARTAPKKMDLEKSGTEKRRAAATEGRKSARQKIIDKRRSMECE